MDSDPFSLLIVLVAADSVIIIKCLVLIVLLASSAMVSGAEVAFFGLSQTEINEIDHEKSSRGNIIVRLLERPKKLLATILIANNSINIGIVLLFNSIGEILFQSITYRLFDVVSIRFLLEVVVATFLILLFGEIIPKIYANRNRRVFFPFFAYLLRILDIFFSPLSTPMRFTSLLLYS